MKKAPAKKNTTHKAPRKKTYFISIRYIIFGVVILALLLSGKIYSGLSKTHVLGASTSNPVLLADHGGDDSEGSGGRGDSGGSGGGAAGSNSGSNSSGGPNGGGADNHGGSGGSSNTTNTSATTPQPSDSTTVDCVGPDGKHFTTEFHNCQELNQKWGHSNFNFTPLNNVSAQVQQEKPEATPSVTQSKEQLEVQTEGNKGELNLQSQGLQVEIKREDNGQVTIHAHQEGGQEVQLKTEDALAKINDSLKEQDVEVGTASADQLEVKTGSISARTTFPLSVDPATNTLAITTPNGTKDVTVLPNQAVAGILQANILSSVLSQSPTTASSSANSTTVIGLTTQNNQPVFEVQGVKEKHLFGIFPVAFQKTVTVSAQTGQVISTQENLINSILESISF